LVLYLLAADLQNRRKKGKKKKEDGFYLSEYNHSKGKKRKAGNRLQAMDFFTGNE